MDLSKQKGFSKLIVKFVNKAIEDGKMKTRIGILHDNIEKFVDIINKEKDA